jgi:hypothetical protein
MQASTVAYFSRQVQIYNDNLLSHFLMLIIMPFIITRTFTETSEVFHTFPTERPRICPQVITPGAIHLDLEIHEPLQYFLIVMVKEITAAACQC